MTNRDNRPSGSEIADWSKRRDALAEEIKSFPYPPDEAWLRELVVRQTSPLAEAGRRLEESVPINRKLAEAAAETDQHLKEKIVNAESHAEADIENLRALMRRCLAAMDAWIDHHGR